MRVCVGVSTVSTEMTFSDDLLRMLLSLLPFMLLFVAKAHFEVRHNLGGQRLSGSHLDNTFDGVGHISVGKENFIGKNTLHDVRLKFMA